MNAREGIMSSEEFGDELRNLYPVVEKNLSDSGSLDNVVEFLVQCGNRSLPEAMVTLVPEAWKHDELMSDLKKSYYKWNAFSMEPWDGPGKIYFMFGLYNDNKCREKAYIIIKLP